MLAFRTPSRSRAGRRGALHTQAGESFDAIAPRRNSSGITRAGVVGTLLLIAVLGYVVVESFNLEAATCEVCMSYNGRSQCRSVSGSTAAEARQAAITNACAFLSSGVTDTMACGRQVPVSEKCQ